MCVCVCSPLVSNCIIISRALAPRALFSVRLHSFFVAHELTPLHVGHTLEAALPMRRRRHKKVKGAFTASAVRAVTRGPTERGSVRGST